MSIFKKGLSLAVLVVLVGLVGCATLPPTVGLSGPPGPYFVSTTYTLTAIGSPGSGAGLWTYSFSASPAGCVTFLGPNPTPPGSQTTVTMGVHAKLIGTCTITVTLQTASGKTATASITRDVLSPNRGWFYVKDGTYPTDSVIGLNGDIAGDDCDTVGGDECDDDDGDSYTNFPPTGGGTGSNSVIAGHRVNPGDNLAVVRYGGGDIGAHDLYIHVTDDVGANESEPNGSVATATPVPALPLCSEVFSEALGNQNPGTPYNESVPDTAAADDWLRHGEISPAGDYDYYGPIALAALETIVVWVDGTPDTVGGDHNHDGSSLDGMISLRRADDTSVITGAYPAGEIDGCFGYDPCAEGFSVQPGAGTYYIRVMGYEDETHAYTMTACKF